MIKNKANESQGENNVSNYTQEISSFFKSNPELFEKLLELDFKKQEIRELKRKNGNLTTPIVVTISGTPRAGKTTCVDNLTEFFRKADFRVSCLSEPAGIVYAGLKNRDEKKKLLQDRVGFVDKQFEIGSTDINEALSSSDIIICDRGVLDTYIWINMYYHKGMIDSNQYREFLERIKQSKKYIDCFYGLFTTSKTSMERDYINSLSIEPRTTMNRENIERYNSSLLELLPDYRENCESAKVIDTTNLNRMDASVIVANDIIKRIRKLY
ncbi:MAG: ATP-binding protein [Ruminococcus sp.]|nr:ATP-binding protein [Ruminococcus sp.]